MDDGKKTESEQYCTSYTTHTEVDNTADRDTNASDNGGTKNVDLLFHGCKGTK